MRHLNTFNIFNESINSNLSEKDAHDLIYQIYQYKDELKDDKLIKKCQDRLYIYDKDITKLVIDSIFNKDIKEKDIIESNLDSQMLIQAFEDCFSVFTAEGIYSEDDEIEN